VTQDCGILLDESASHYGILKKRRWNNKEAEKKRQLLQAEALPTRSNIAYLKRLLIDPRKFNFELANHFPHIHITGRDDDSTVDLLSNSTDDLLLIDLGISTPDRSHPIRSQKVQLILNDLSITRQDDQAVPFYQHRSGFFTAVRNKPVRHRQRQ
jgi:hypothetical protein